MGTLARKTARDFWRIRWRALTVALAVACGVGVLGGIGMATGSLRNSRDVSFDRLGFADLEIQFLPEDVANLPDLGALPGVQAVERRLILPGTVLLGDGRRLAGTFVLLETPRSTINRLELLAGGPMRPEDFESAVIDRSLADFHRIRVGDRVPVQVGETVYESRVDGVALSPEYLATTVNLDYVVPEKGALGVVFANLDRLSDALGFTMVNDLLIRFATSADPAAVQAAVVEQLGRLNLERVIPKEEHFIWKYLEIDIEAFEIYVPSIAVTLGGLAFLLCLVTVHQLVMDQRREIGALLAIGYGPVQLLRAYLAAGAGLGAAGGLMGVGLSFVFRNLFAGTYAHAMGLASVAYVIRPQLLTVAVAAGVLVTTAATALPVLRLLRLPPQVIIREPIGGERAAPAWLRGLAPSTGGLPTPVRFGLRNLGRRPSRTLATILAIACALGVSIAYLVAVTSSRETIESAFRNERWDLAVDFLHPVFLEDLEPIRALSGVAAVEPYFRRFAEVGAAGRYEGASILGIQPQNGMKRTQLTAGRFLSGADGELILNQDLARRLAVAIGDRVTIRIRRGAEYSFRVVGISGEVVLGQVMMPFREAQRITHFNDEATGAYIETTRSAPGLVDALNGLESVAKVTAKAGVISAYRRLMADRMGIIHLAAGVNIFVAMLVVLTTVHLTIAERAPEFVTFKCLGYGRARLSAIVLTEALGQGSLGGLLSVPLGIALAMYLNGQMSRAWFEVTTVLQPRDIVGVLAAGMAAITFATYGGARSLEGLDLARTLRTRLIE